VYVFNNETGRLLHSLPGTLLITEKRVSNTSTGLVKPVRAVKFSPGGKLLAAAGDAKVIALFDVKSGEQVANLTGHSAWIFSLDFSSTGEYLLSGLVMSCPPSVANADESRSFDGKTKVWSIDTRSCVATHTETDKTIWSVKWLARTTRSEGFAAAGANRSISFYREATGG
jgi:superkiller protein 8